MAFPIGLNDGAHIQLGDFTVHGIPAKHNELARDANGNCLYMGYVFQFGRYAVYHSGDTLWFDGMEEILRPYDVDVALLPINGNKPERRVAGNLDAREAVSLANKINADVVIPCHYDMFTFNTADVREFENLAQEVGQDYRVLLGGDCYIKD